MLLISVAFKRSVNALQIEEKEYCNVSLNENFDDDEIVVVLKNSESLLCKKYDLSSFQEISPIEVLDLSEGYNELITKQLNGEKNNKINLEKFNRIIKIKLDIKSKTNVLNAIAKLEEREDIKLVKPFMSSEIDFFSNITPNDTQYNNQWHIQNSKVDSAWTEYTTGLDNVLVGVIDTGINVNNVDLSSVVNADLSRSFDNNNTNPLTDSTGHGTAVAGIIGAKANNNNLIAGVCWSSQIVSLKMPIYTDDEIANGSSYTPHIIEAIEYAGSIGIDILNISWACACSSELLEAIENFPGLIICSAGNQNRPLDNNFLVYPACYNQVVDNIISVGAHNEDNYRWASSTSGSNYSDDGYVDIYAPGYNITSTWINSQGYISNLNGTSFAAPIVTGVAALLHSYHKNIDYSHVKNAILQGSDVLEDEDLGFRNNRKLNAYKAFNNFHPLTLSYDYYNIDYHICSCTLCDCEFFEEHTWILAPSNARIPIISNQYICAQCQTIRFN